MLTLLMVVACTGASRDFSLLLLKIYDKCLKDATTTWNVVTKTVWSLADSISRHRWPFSFDATLLHSCKAIVSSSACYCIDWSLRMVACIAVSRWPTTVTDIDRLAFFLNYHRTPCHLCCNRLWPKYSVASHLIGLENYLKVSNRNL